MSNNRDIQQSVRHRKMFDFSFLNAPNLEEVVNLILKYESCPKNECKKPFVITPNAYQIVEFNKDYELKKQFKNSLFILADGQPIVWYSKLKKDSLAIRLPGSCLFPILWRKIKNQQKTFFIVPNNFIGEKFKEEDENIQYYAPPIFDPKDTEEITALTNSIYNQLMRYRPKFVFIGLGFPKQEILALNLFNKFQEEGDKPPLFLLLGASFEFYLNLKKRAPHIYQKLGLEWLYRFSQEPKRLWKRYLIGNFKFILLCIEPLISQKPSND